MTYLPLFEKDCRWFAALTSFVISLLLGWDALINSDGILYIMQARLINDGAFSQALALYPWPGYAYLIWGVHALFGPSLEHAAVLINATCYGLLVAGFVTVIQQAGGNRAVQWLAAITLLIFPTANDYREYIIRDAGFWGMMFWGIYALVRFHEKREWRDVLLWTVSMGIALLFRVEVAALIVLAPFGLLFLKPKRSFKDVIHLQSLFIVCALILTVAVFSVGQKAWLGRLHELPIYLSAFIDAGTLFVKQAERLTDIFPDQFKSKYGMVALSGALLFYVVYMWAKVVTPFYLILSGITIHQKLFHDSLAKRYIVWFIGINTFIVIVFLLKSYFLSSRYLMPLGLLSITFVPFAIHHIALARGNGTLLGRPFMFPIMTLILIAMFVSGIHSFGHSKEYLREAGQWIHAHVKPDAKMFIAEKHVAYYAERYDILAHNRMLKMTSENFKGQQVIVLYRDADTKEINDYIAQHFASVRQQHFQNEKGDGVTIVIVDEGAIQ